VYRISELDGLRGWAILLVLCGHFPFVQGVEQIRHLAMSVGSGHLGVTVFFVLSGFLITRILIREKEEGRFSMRRFYLKRTLRIFPIYYLTLLIVGIFITDRHAGWLAIYLGNFVFAMDGAPHPMRHTWSLAVEEHFYLVWPLIIGGLPLLTSKRIVRYVLPVFAILCAVLMYAMMPRVLSDNLVYRGTMTQILPLCLGAAIAFDEESWTRLPTWPARLLLLLTPVLGVVASRFRGLPYEGQESFVFAGNLILYSLTAVCILLLVLNARGGTFGWLRWPISFALNNPVIRSIGTVSYGIYLYHFPILYVLGLLPDETVLAPVPALGLLALLFAVPYASWHLIEAPILRWKDQLTGVHAVALK
jgi:peptidoglycan/LPS O-acetylase OafA/YrhL